MAKRKELHLGLVILHLLVGLKQSFFFILLGLQLRYDRALLLAFLVCVEASFIGSNKKLIDAFPKRTEYAKPPSLFSGSHAQCCVIQEKVLFVVS